MSKKNTPDTAKTAVKNWGPVVASGIAIAISWITGIEWIMLVAAVIAGYRIAISAVQALRVKLISIDLLVVTAAVGAVFIDNYWESAAVTFLFALGKALETATLRKTRKALSDLVDQAPMTALLQRLAAVRGRLSLCADQAAAAKWWLSMPMASVSAEGPMPKALSTRRTSPLMPGCRHQGRACPLRRARMTSNPLIVA